MIALRKDVKVGFTIGGVVLGVFGVYLGLSALAGEKPNGSMTGANLQITPFTPTPASVAVTDRTPTRVADSTPKAAATPIVTNPTPPALANPSEQLVVPQNGGQDLWGNAFETGSVQPVVTVTPDARVAGSNAPKPADVVSAINQPEKAGTSGISSTPARSETGTATASTNEPSGSLTSQTSSTLLTPADTTTSSAQETQTHTVEVGETFSSIAAIYYGDSKYFKSIVDANPQLDPSKLKPGMKVTVPPLARKEPRSDTTDVPAASSIDPNTQYVVKSGDSLSKIATTLYGDQNMWQKIYDFNKSTIGDSPAKLKLGMVLKLPTPPTRKQ